MFETLMQKLHTKADEMVSSLGNAAVQQYHVVVASILNHVEERLKALEGGAPKEAAEAIPAGVPQELLDRIEKLEKAKGVAVSAAAVERIEKLEKRADEMEGVVTQMRTDVDNKVDVEA